MEGAERRPTAGNDHALTGELAVSLVAMYVAVVALTQTFGDTTSLTAATLLGAAIAAIIGLATFRRGLRAIPRSVFAMMAVSVTVLATLSGRDALENMRENNDLENVRETILSSYAEEIAWYQHPTEDRRPVLERYFLRPEEGGARLAVVVAAVERLRRCNRRIAARAYGSTFVNEITFVGATARADTTQSLFQPIEDFKNGQWRPRTLRPQDEVFYTPDQVYLLKKVQGKWYVADAPQPQNLGAC